MPFNFQRTPLSMQRQCLPIAKHRTQLLYALEQFSVIVIVGETGSGKSTQIPQYLFENGWCDEGFTVCCTQPRRIAAQTLAQRVSQEVGTTLGQIVGYTVRFDDKTGPETCIKYCTDGILLREAALSDPLLSQYSVIMIDEAHELNLNTEILLGVVKKIRRKRKDLRIIISSASINAEAFLDFFIPKKVRDENVKDDEKAPPRRKRWGKVGDNVEQEAVETINHDDGIENRGVIISIDGRQHPVDVLFSEKPVADYVEATVDTVLSLHFQDSNIPDSGDILCFVATGEEIDRAVKMAEDRVDSMGDVNGGSVSSQIVFLPLYGTLPYHLQSRVFQPKPVNDTRRRVIFATNIAETSVTVPNIGSVIDCGFVKLPYFDQKTGFDRLIVSPISHASALQVRVIAAFH
jgi:ATP-dependent RNA helicase DDX35